MVKEKISLTQEELEELKDDIKFRTKTTLMLKILEAKVDKINGLKERVGKLEVHKSVHWFLLSAIIIWLLRMAMK